MQAPLARTPTAASPPTPSRSSGSTTDHEHRRRDALGASRDDKPVARTSQSHFGAPGMVTHSLAPCWRGRRGTSVVTRATMLSAQPGFEAARGLVERSRRRPPHRSWSNGWLSSPTRGSPRPTASSTPLVRLVRHLESQGTEVMVIAPDGHRTFRCRRIPRSASPPIPGARSAASAASSPTPSTSRPRGRSASRPWPGCA